MDEIDLILIQKLLENSRLTFRELAEITNISISAIHKRITKLENEGFIKNYIARPSISALKYLWIVIFGESKAKSMESISKELGQHENINAVVITGGKFLYIAGLIRDLSELQDFSSYVSKTAQINDPTVGIVNIPYQTIPEPLTTIDYKILKALNKDARKSITDITDDTGLSAKTVRKRLDRMMEYNLATFSIEWLPLYKDSFISLNHIFLNEGTDISSTIKYINDKYSENAVNCTSYSNIPNFIIFEVWTKTIQESQVVLEELLTEGFKDIIPHIIIGGDHYDCWLDQLLRTK